MNKKWTYIGIFLDATSSKLLINQAMDYIPDGAKLYAHHMTCAFNSDGDMDGSVFGKYKPLLGKEYTLEINAIGASEKAVAGHVSNYPIDGKVTHVTVAVTPLGKPVDSNYIKHWVPLKRPFTVKGRMGYFANGTIHYE